MSESMKFLLAQETTQTKKEEATGAGLLLTMAMATCSHRQARAKRKEAMKD